MSNQQRLFTKSDIERAIAEWLNNYALTLDGIPQYVFDELAEAIYARGRFTLSRRGCF